MNVIKHINADLIIKNISFILFFVMTIAFFSNKMAAMINISSGLLLLIIIYLIIVKKMHVISSLKKLILQRKTFFIFTLWCFISCVFFTYSNFTKEALILFFKDWRYPIIVLLFLALFYEDLIKIKSIFIRGMMIGLAITIFVAPFLLNITNDNRPLHIIIRNQLGGYIAFLYPFTLAAAFYVKNKLLKILLFFIVFATFAFLFYTGLRGVLLATFIESFIIIFLFTSHIKKFFLFSCLFIIILGVITSTAYYALPQFKQKIDQTIQNKNISSSRDLIITSRYPLFLNSPPNIIGGVGYNSSTYNLYLQDHNALKAGGIGYYNHNNEYIYNNDEPFLFTIWYSVGLVGLLLFLSALFINLKDIYQSLKNQKDIFNVGLFAAGIGYFLIYCCFELISMRVFILFSVISLLCIIKKKK